MNSPGQRAGKDQAELTEEQRTGWRIAAIILVCNVFLGSAVAFATRSAGAVVGWIVALVLARNLYRFRSGTDTITVVLACLGAVVIPIISFLRSPAAVALFLSAGTWGSSAAILMLLLGRPSRSQRVAAVLVYAILSGGTYALVIATALTAR